MIDDSVKGFNSEVFNHIIQHIKNDIKKLNLSARSKYLEELNYKLIEWKSIYESGKAESSDKFYYLFSEPYNALLEMALRRWIGDRLEEHSNENDVEQFQTLQKLKKYEIYVPHRSIERKNPTLFDEWVKFIKGYNDLLGLGTIDQIRNNSMQISSIDERINHLKTVHTAYIELSKDLEFPKIEGFAVFQDHFRGNKNCMQILDEFKIAKQTLHDLIRFSKDERRNKEILSGNSKKNEVNKNKKKSNRIKINLTKNRIEDLRKLQKAKKVLNKSIKEIKEGALIEVDEEKTAYLLGQWIWILSANDERVKYKIINDNFCIKGENVKITNYKATVKFAKTREEDIEEIKKILDS